MPVSAGTHVLYTVRPGDTLASIADAFGTNVGDLVKSNSMYSPITDADLIYPGWVLLVRLPGMSRQSAVLYQVNPGDSLFRISERFGVGIDMLAALNGIQQPNQLRVAQLLYMAGFVYEVEPGDTLYRIARRFGVNLGELFRWNESRPGLSPDLVYPGFKLALPLPASTNIVVTDPLPGTRIAHGQRLAGAARAFEAAILYQIVDGAGRVVARERPAMTSAGAPAFGQFELTMQLDRPPAVSEGVIMVYTRSAKDGSVQDMVEVPVTFA